jgi:hypothetical protein
MTQPDIAKNLQSLRAAAAARDWRGYYAALSPLLACLPAADAVEFVLAQLRAYLPRFESYAPDVTWPRKRLYSLSISGPDYAVARQHPWLPEFRHEAPGAAHFVQAMRYVWQAAVNIDRAGNYIPYLVGAVVSVRMADLEELWYGPRPRAWDQWSLAMKTQIGAQQPWKVAIMFDRDPAIQRRDTAAWLAVADELERRITAACTARSG